MMLEKIFFKSAVITLVSIYLVILAGSVVRTTGSGMGCPDWPKCFDRWIPPTDINELPIDYKEQFLERRIQKVEKYTSMLSKLGMEQAASTILNDPEIRKEEPFVAVKTWIEYVNRLLGFIGGNFTLLLFVLSFFLYKKNKKLLLLSFVTLLCMGFQGWFGSMVVASNLIPWTISVHMFFALVIIALLIHLIYEKNHEPLHIPNKIRYMVLAAFILGLVQIYFGTQVRQGIDVLSSQDIVRSEWIENLPSIFKVHRSFAIVVLLINGYIILQLKSKLPRLMFFIFGVLLIEVLSGVIMAYCNVPKFMQPTHLFLSTILFGLHYYLLIRTRSQISK